MNRKLFFPFGIIVFLLVSLLVSGGSAAQAACLTDTVATPCGGFKPSWGPAGTTPVLFSSTATGAHPDITTSLNIDPPSKNFAESITFADSAVPTSAVPVGAYVGKLDSVAQLGLANSGCFNAVPVTFNFVSATVSQTNVISPAGPASNVDANFAEDDGNLKNDHQTILTVAAPATSTTLTVLNAAAIGANGSGGQTIYMGGATTPENKVVAAGGVNTVANTITLASATANAHNVNDTVDIPDVPAFAFNGIADGADAYPSFLQTAFLGIVPQARYQGVAFVAGSLIVLLNLVIFNPGDLAALPNHAWMTAAWGAPSVAVLNDPVAAPSNSAITDFCNFTSTTALLGVTHDNGCTPVVTLQNQPGCTGTGAGFTLRLACDATAAPAGCTTLTSGSTCGLTGTSPCNEAGSNRATNPASPQTVKWRSYAMSLRDADGDGIDNTLDPCPFNVDTVWDPYAIAPLGDTDGDGIPDTCDTVVSPPGNTDQDGDGWTNRGDNCPLLGNPGSGVTTPPNTGQFDQDVPPAASVPDGGPHSDNLGAVCDVTTNGIVASPTTLTGGYNATVIAQKICIGAVTSDCSTTLDTDGDGIKNAFDNCIGGANAPIAGPPAYAQSQRDLNGDGSADISDIALLAGAFGKVGGLSGAPAGYEGRLDLNYDNSIDISDISLEAAVFGKTC